MVVRKRLTAAAAVNHPPRHRYPTRWKLCQESVENITVHVPCKLKKPVKCTLNLPRDIIFDILLLVPVTDLHHVVRYVCKQWNDIVNDPCFIKAHCQLSSAGLLVQNPVNPYQVYYIEGDNSSEIAFPFPARIFGSFNGLVLFLDLNNQQILIVTNPVTKVKMSLPPVHGLNHLRSSIGFAITSFGHYKVVVTLRDEGHSSKLQMMVFTIDIDKAWRFIDLQGISEMEAINYAFPRFIAGMLYWFNLSNPCLAMDVDTETIYLVHKPNDFDDQLASGRFLSLGACLGLAQEDTGNWKLWKLTDVKSGKWTKLTGINISEALSTVRKELYPKFCQLCVPVMLIDDIFWFYYVVEQEFVIIRFNLANQSFVFFPNMRAYFFTYLFHHVHTLLSPNKCYYL